MSLQFNDTTTYRGIVQEYEREIGANIGDISGNTTKLKEFTAMANLAFDDFFHIAFGASGTWQFDDTSTYESDGVTERRYPIITTNLVSGQRDYTFSTDGQSNIILDVFKVLVADANGNFSEIKPVDQQTQNSQNNPVVNYLSGQNNQGTPNSYDKTGNGIFLDPIPSYNYTGGLKMLVNREPSYFVYTDTTKKPGIPGNLHKWFALKPALEYARRNNLTSFNRLYDAVTKMEKVIEETFARRQRDTKNRMLPNVENTK